MKVDLTSYGVAMSYIFNLTVIILNILALLNPYISIYRIFILVIDILLLISYITIISYAIYERTKVL